MLPSTFHKNDFIAVLYASSQDPKHTGGQNVGIKVVPFDQAQSRRQDLGRPLWSPLQDLRARGLEARMEVCQAMHHGHWHSSALPWTI